MNDSQKTPSDSFTNHWLPLLAIMGAVLGWGIYHVAGAIRSGENLYMGLTKAAIILACVLFFLGFWGVALFTRARRGRSGRQAEK